jgi:hypothetical protein
MVNHDPEGSDDGDRDSAQDEEIVFLRERVETYELIDCVHLTYSLFSRTRIGLSRTIIAERLDHLGQPSLLTFPCNGFQ